MNDHLIHFSNRNVLFEDLKHFLENHREAGEKLAVMLISIDRFRRLNTVFGYQKGDDLLEAFADRLDHISRDKDYIARMGNSEFLLVLPQIMNAGHVTLAAHKIINSLQETFVLDDTEHKVTAHIGISLFPEHADSVSELVQKAEIALMSARNSASIFSIYSEESKELDVSAWDIEGDLEEAIEKDEFELYYQPQISIQTGIVFGAEALIRWKTKGRGYIRPDIFIKIAEKSGQIEAITWWTINRALREVSEWPKTWTPLKVAVNVSAVVLKDVAFVSSVKSALSIWGVSSEQLILEITESALMEDTTSSIITLEELKSLGVGISIDDFGTGYSSMAYFKNIPANEIKIDQSFVFYMLKNEMDQHVVNTIIELAHGFSLKVVAEGVEDVDTYNALKELGCDIAQGFYLAKPMPQTEFIKWVEDYKIQR